MCRFGEDGKTIREIDSRLFDETGIVGSVVLYESYKEREML